MKKLLFIVLMAVLSITVSAQDRWGTWTLVHREADDLLGQTAQDVYMYDISGIGSVVIWDWKKPEFRLITNTGFFHQVYMPGVDGLCVPVNVGFYDNNGNLKTKFQLIMFVEDNHRMQWISTGGFYLGGRGNIRKTLEHMRSGDGYVRFVAELSDDQNFDIKVTSYQ